MWVAMLLDFVGCDVRLVRLGQILLLLQVLLKTRVAVFVARF